MAVTGYAHIDLDEHCVPCVDGTRLRVMDIVAEHRYWGRDAEAIHQARPSHSLGAVYSALAYYYDHRALIDQALDQAELMAESVRPSLENPVLLARLRTHRERSTSEWRP